MSLAIDTLIENSVSALIHNALADLPSDVYEAATGKKAKVASEATDPGSVTERPQIPGENDDGFLPLYLNFQAGMFGTLGQLRAIRDVGRVLFYGNEIAGNAIKNRANYVVGEGLTYRLLPKDISVEPDALVAYALAKKEDSKIQLLIANWELFTEKNKFNQRLLDWTTRAHRDGEAIVRIFPTKDVPTVRFIYPDYLEAQDEKSPLGIEYVDVDSEVPINFFVRYPLSTSVKAVPASQVIYDKRNVDMEGWRGLPTGYPVFTNLRRVEKLLVNVSVLAQIQSAIALIRKHENATGAQVNKFLDRTSPDKRVDPVTGNLYRQKTLRSGTILDAPKGTSYDMPAHAIDTKNFIQVIDKELAHIASAFQIPVSWLLTEEPAEPMNPGSPALRSIYTERSILFEKVTELFWKVQELMGINVAKTRAKYELNIEGPDIPVAKAVDQARIDETYQRIGATSPQEIAARKGWRYAANRIETIRHRATAQPGEQMPGDAGATNTGGGTGVTKADNSLKSNAAPGGNTKV